MNKITQIAKNAAGLIKANSPIILTATAVGGVAATGFLAHQAGIKARRDINEAQFAGEMLPTRDLTLEEKVRLVWRHYVPPVLVGTATIVCIIGAQSINARRQAALLGLYTITETAYREYEAKNLEMNGKAADRKVRDAVAQDRVEAATGDKSVIVTGTHILCYDMYTGRFFESDMETIRQAQNDINQRILAGDMYASLNDFYNLLGLESIEIGEENGFTVDTLIDLDFSSVLKESKPALAISFRASPVPEYHRFR